MAKRKHNEFITPRQYVRDRDEQIRSDRGWLLILDNDDFNGVDSLAKRVVKEYESLLETNGEHILNVPFIDYSLDSFGEKGPLVRTFEDSETCPRIPTHIAGSDAYLFASSHEFITDRTVNDNIYRLFQTVRTLKSHGANNITVVSPYLPYARQDKPSFSKRECTGAKLFADLLYGSGANGILFYDPHNETLRGFFEPNIRVTTLSGLDLFVDIYSRFKKNLETVCVSTDAGGSKPIIRMAGLLELAYAIGNKYRPEQEKVEKIGIIGEVKGKKTALLSDDETVTFKSLLGIASGLKEDYGVKETYVALSHMKLTRKNISRMIDAHENYGVKEVHITDSIPQSNELLSLDFVKVHPLAERVMYTINRLHYDRSITALYHRI